MKKLFLALLSPICALVLSSCNIRMNFGSSYTYVPWYFVAVPVIVIVVVAHICFVSGQYECPKCGKVFKPKWYEFSSWLHIGSKRVVRCPECKYKGFCRKHK